jgi:HAD superfamily phosphatase
MSAIVLFDIDGVVRDVAQSYRRALADTVAHFTDDCCRPTPSQIDALKGEGIWNNDWEASQELIYRFWESQGKSRTDSPLDYPAIVAFFQSKYRGTDSVNWNGYICNEPLLVSREYFATLTDAQIPWGFVSGATRGSAEFVLKSRLCLEDPVLIAMEDAPGKPDPQGVLMAVDLLAAHHSHLDRLPLIYVGDTVADIHTALRARSHRPQANCLGVGILPPHVTVDPQVMADYTQSLMRAGAEIVFDRVEKLTPQVIDELLS